MIKYEVFVGDNSMIVNDYNVRPCVYDDNSMTWDVSTDMFGYDCCFDTLEQAIKYCMEVDK